MRNNSYKLNWYYEYNIQEANNRKILSKYIYILIIFGHFKKSASILTDQDTQMVGNDWWLTTICNADQGSINSVLIMSVLWKKTEFYKGEIDREVIVIAAGGLREGTESLL